MRKWREKEQTRDNTYGIMRMSVRDKVCKGEGWGGGGGESCHLALNAVLTRIAYQINLQFIASVNGFFALDLPIGSALLGISVSIAFSHRSNPTRPEIT